ncbi:hypothetical protein, partial [Chamaesiphon polymorphus]
MYSQLLAYYQTNYKLACYCIAIAGWYLVIASSAHAQTHSTTAPPPDRLERDNSILERETIGDSSQIASTTTDNPDVTSEDDRNNRDRQTHPSAKPRVT